MTTDGDADSGIPPALEHRLQLDVPAEYVLISSSLLLMNGQGEVAFELVENWWKYWRTTGGPGERMLLAEMARIDALPGARRLEHIEEAIAPAAEVVVRWPDSEDARLCLTILQTVRRDLLQSHRNAAAALIANPNREEDMISDTVIAAKIALYEAVIKHPIVAAPPHDSKREAEVLAVRLERCRQLNQSAQVIRHVE